MPTRTLSFTIAFLLFGVLCVSAVELTPVKLVAVRREPVAAIFWNDNLAAIACAKSGTLIFWDIARGEIKHEFQVGKQLRGVARFGDDELLVIDDKSHELIRLKYGDGELAELERIAVPAYPASLLTYMSTNGKQRCAVASLWSRQISIWHNEGTKLRRESLIDLTFEPRLMAGYESVITTEPPVRSTSDFLVTGAFQNELVKIYNGSSRPVPRLASSAPAHNIGGLAFTPEHSLFVLSQQILNQNIPLAAENVANGRVIRNILVREPGVEIHNDGLLVRVGPNDRWIADQNADPAGIAFTKEGMLVCLAGVNQVWYQPRRFATEYERIPVGVRPRIVIARDDLALVLGELDDSITRIETKDVDNPLVTKSILDPALANRELSPAERGERLFFSGKMSAGGMLSCHSCHTDGHTNGLLADTLGDNTHGTPKRVLTLRGTRLTDLWAWNGEMKTLQDNVFKSLKETMHAPEIKPADVDDIVSFLHTLPPVPPLKPVPVSETDREQLARGEKIFQREKCGSCHVPPLTFTSHAVYDVGLADEKGLRKFNPPSLRGVGRLKKLFHDNRASSLRDVFETHGHQLAEPLPAKDLDDLVRYLESL